MYAILFTLLAANSYLLYKGIFRFAIKPSALDSDDEDDADITAFSTAVAYAVSDEWHYYAMVGYYHSRLINEIRNGEPVKLRPLQDVDPSAQDVDPFLLVTDDPSPDDPSAQDTSSASAT